jgi:protein-S-isoprenylcysteine O-methyltransferase Ste14
MHLLKVIGGIVYTVAFFAGALFIPAGTIYWWRAWVLLGAVLACVIATMFVLAGDDDLLNERYRSPVQNGQPLADKILTLLLIPSFAGLLVFIPLDVFRFHCLERPGALLSALGLVLFASGWIVITLALRENTFAAPVVKHQKERHQAVIDSGVYRIVRHPMYAGAVLLMFGMALWLQSYAAALFALIPIAVLAARVLVEERLLRSELAGYDAYVARVRYRLIPFVW